MDQALAVLLALAGIVVLGVLGGLLLSHMTNRAVSKAMTARSQRPRLVPMTRREQRRLVVLTSADAGLRRYSMIRQAILNLGKQP
jgi:hypothetical protein